MSDHNQGARPAGGPNRGRGPMGGGGPMGAMGRPVEKPKNFKASFARLVHYLAPFRTRLIVVFILAIASTVFTIATPKIMGHAMDKVKDSYMAGQLIGSFGSLQNKVDLGLQMMMSGIEARESAKTEAAKSPKSDKATQAAPEAATPAEGTPSQDPSPVEMAALKNLLSLPLISEARNGDERATAVGTFLSTLTTLPPAVLDQMKQFTGSVAGSGGPNVGQPSSMSLTADQMKDAIRAIRDTDGKFDWPAIGVILLTLLGLYLISAGFSFAMQWVMSTVAQKTVYELRKSVEAKLSRLPLKYFDARSHGDILSRVTNDVDTISTTLQQSVTQVITSIISLLGILVMMFTISLWLTLIEIATLPLYIIVTMLIAKNSQKFFAAQQKELGALSGHVEEMYSGHAIVKAFGQEKESIRIFNETNERLTVAARKANFVSGIMFPAMSFVSNLGYVLISVIGGTWITGGRLSIGDIVAFIQYSRQFTMPIIQTANIANILQSTIACAERVFEVLDEEEESPDPVPAKSLAAPRGDVAIANLAFRYKPEVPLIGNLNLAAQQGHTVAIVGPTGAGKTTLVNLLMRFYEIDEGSITIDGVDVREMSRSGLRNLFGMVLQDTWVFNGTIRDNIAYGRPDASEAAIKNAAQAAHADHFIRTLPDGYDTVLNEEATNISQGQKQLITIARAILADPAILILDEATSSVDTRTEVLIQKAMANLMADRTSFVIAHRLSTIRDAELILVMDKGDIVEQGNHKELLAKGGFYAELYNAQFAGAEI